jgi:hypothetical protein
MKHQDYFSKTFRWSGARLPRTFVNLQACRDREREGAIGQVACMRATNTSHLQELLCEALSREQAN